VGSDGGTGAAAIATIPKQVTAVKVQTILMTHLW
jgi:hypothetical protein